MIILPYRAYRPLELLDPLQEPEIELHYQSHPVQAWKQAN